MKNIVRILGTTLSVFVAGFIILAVFNFGTTAYTVLYGVLQFVGLALVWNLMFGKLNYVNFGTAGFFGTGGYITAYLLTKQITAFSLAKLFPAMIAGGLGAAGLGLVIALATMRLRGIYFAIATLAVAVVMMRVVQNTPALGAGHGLYFVPPSAPAIFSTLTELLVLVMFAVVLVAVAIIWYIDSSWIGDVFTAIGNDETAARAVGINTYRVKFSTATLHAFLFGLVGSSLVLFQTYIDPPSTFSINYSINAVAMPLLGGTGVWFGPIVGAVILATVREMMTLFWGSQYSQIIPGIVLIVVISAAPHGLTPYLQAAKRRITSIGSSE
ncbi:hypothetical protein AKJ40_02010 [candidate division MSBL1 archaeon SCGC-AAA259M10]|uniref:Branched-chain amino acid ABC transporter permease n=1 Tax=candidate division MSBL1 archaeon SCGC-AAA259M10 TaxID=1698270 RepID=A0A133V0S4_9EURY|nr:hypothetical protein AKJ40_02010 [candidate division MSBL1 archaeon SCGC-AAA259M10]